MTCQQAIEMFGDLLDEDIDRANRFRLKLHLLICRHCRRYLSSYRATLAAEKAWSESARLSTKDELPDDVVRSILNRRGVRGGEG